VEKIERAQRFGEPSTAVYLALAHFYTVHPLTDQKLRFQKIPRKNRNDPMLRKALCSKAFRKDRAED
jgi:hypothetical protein